ncbi:MAG: cobyrinic acid a,c-diamide synthase [Ruminococcaceae bacterium]|nr:cobyrinic acid a,c-diamide synthase [Oscillospiraceae bacterium]
MRAKIVAVAGKGGVGKTSISAAVLRELVARHPDAKILAIDADPAVGLATALGVEPPQTLDDIRKSLAGDAVKTSPDELTAEARFRLFDAMVETRGFAFLAIGRPETAGCYCTVNGYLKEVISLLAGDFDYVVIDGEAGIEQINRRVMEKVTHLLLITDQSRKGYQVIETVKRVADELVMYESCGVIINRATRPELVTDPEIAGAPVLAVIGPDPMQAKNDVRGGSVFDLPDDSNVIQGTRKAVSLIDL